MSPPADYGSVPNSGGSRRRLSVTANPAVKRTDCQILLDKCVKFPKIRV